MPGGCATRPKTGEDRQLAAYWRARASGILYTEVKLGGKHWPEPPWSGHARRRRLDGVIVDGPFGDRRGHRAFVTDSVAPPDRSCELIEVKAGLSEFVLGQALVGRWLFEVQVARPRGLEIRRNVALARHIDPAMRWVAQRVGVDVETSIDVPKHSFTKSRRKYALQDARLLRLARWRHGEHGGGLVLTRVPLAGPASGVLEWEGAAPIWIDFVHIPSEPPGPGVVVYGAEHRSLLANASLIELIFVGRHDLGRGGVGVLAAHATMFERQYQRSFTVCRLICGASDPAIAAACRELPQQFSLPAFEIHAVGRVDAADPRPEDHG